MMDSRIALITYFSLKIFKMSNAQTFWMQLRVKTHIFSGFLKKNIFTKLLIIIACSIINLLYEMYFDRDSFKGLHLITKFDKIKYFKLNALNSWTYK